MRRAAIHMARIIDFPGGYRSIRRPRVRVCGALNIHLQLNERTGRAESTVNRARKMANSIRPSAGGRATTTTQSAL